MSEDRRLFGLVRYLSYWTFREEGYVMPRWWGPFLDSCYQGRMGYWIAPIPLNVVLSAAVWFHRLLRCGFFNGYRAPRCRGCVERGRWYRGQTDLIAAALRRGTRFVPRGRRSGKGAAPFIWDDAGP